MLAIMAWGLVGVCSCTHYMVFLSPLRYCLSLLSPDSKMAAVGIKSVSSSFVKASASRPRVSVPKAVTSSSVRIVSKYSNAVTYVSRPAGRGLAVR